MDKLSIQRAEWIRKLRPGKTKLTVHNVCLHSNENDISYITSAAGTVHTIHTDIDDTYNVLYLSLELCIFPFTKHIRNDLPPFKHMIPDPDNQSKTIFKDDKGTVYVRIVHQLSEDTIERDPRESLNVPGVFLGINCRDNCYNKCFKHGIIQPYSYQRG